jgi:hypothetical protein
MTDEGGYLFRTTGAMSAIGTFETCRLIQGCPLIGEDRKSSADRQNDANAPDRTQVAQESSRAFFTAEPKLRLCHFDLCWLRGLLSVSCCRAVRSTTGRYDRHSSSSAAGMEVAADPEYAPRQVCPTNRQRAQAPRERSNRKLCRRQGRQAFSDAIRD